MPEVKKIASYLEELAPLSIAMPGDPVGLQLGSPDAEVSNILVALDPDFPALEEAAAKGADMVVTHHPLFYHQLSSINESRPEGALIAGAIRDRLNIYSAHTNLDIAPRGITCQLAETLGLQVENAEILEVTGSEHLLKLVVFVPVGHENNIRDALAAAGAGQIGNYSHCTFQVRGTGTFMPGEGTDPYIGSSGKLEKADELRIETILPATRRAGVVKALVEAHPYEEVAYDLYPLDLEGKAIGMGLIIEPEKALPMAQLIQLCKGRLNTELVRSWSNGKDSFRRIALCGGSGGSMIESAARKKADIFISGDFRYHDLKRAEAMGLALVDAGHDATEKPGIEFLGRYLEEKLRADGYETGVFQQTSAGAKWD